MVGPEHRALPFEGISVQIPGLTEAALGTQHVGNLELKVQIC